MPLLTKVGGFNGSDVADQVIDFGFTPVFIFNGSTGNGIDSAFVVPSWSATVGYRVSTNAGTFDGYSISGNVVTFTKDTNLNNAGGGYYYVGIGGSSDYITTGSYTGDASNSRAFTGLGFSPDAVFIQCVTQDVKKAFCWDVVKSPSNAGALDSTLSGKIISMDTDGFTIDSDNNVNQNALNYKWVAIKSYPNVFYTNSYTGNGNDDRDITVPGFQPIAVFIKQIETTTPGVMRNTSHSGDSHLVVTGGSPGNAGDGIQAFLSTGFQIGTGNNINENGKTFNYLCIGEYTGYQGGNFFPFL